MKPATSYTKHRAKISLASCFVALVGLSAAPLWAQTVTDPDAEKDEKVTKLAPFTVSSDKDYGYLKTNAATATRVGAAIQKVPFTIQVIGTEFMQDIDLQSTNDVYKYLASANGDNQHITNRPSNNPTPQGNQSLRGFPVNIMLRNGVFLYSAQNIADTIERIEIIKGPAAVFFGQGYPGGVINYITKKAQFSKIPVTLRYVKGQNNVNRVTLDSNQMLSDKAALRVVGGWNDSKGDQSYEYIKRFNLNASLALRPFGNDKLRLTYEIGHLDEKYNDGGRFAWIFPQGWFNSYANPTAAEIASSGLADATAYKNAINKNLGGWMNWKRKELNNPNAPLYTSVQRGAFYLDASGKKIQDEAFNFNNRGAYTQNKANIKEFTLESQLTDWMDLRYVYSHDKTHFDNREGINYPHANGRTFSVLSPNGSGYYRQTALHQVDLVFKANTTLFTPIKHKVLTGIINNAYIQQYYAPAGGAQYFYIPGYNSYGTNGNSVIPGISGSVPVGQQLFDRFGVAKTAAQVYTDWDPGFEIQPPVDKITSVNRNVLDGYDNQDNAWYLNYQGSLLEDRLTVMAGWRSETYRQAGQVAIPNFPWFAPPPYAGNDTVTYDPAVWAYSPGYALSNFSTQKGDSWMAGASYELKKDVNVYATVSKTFKYNGTGTLTTWIPYVFNSDLNLMYTTILNAYASIGKAAVYTFPDGSTRTLTTAADALKAHQDDGAFNKTKNETGKNIEIGMKTSLFDGKITSTVSIYQASRAQQRKEDSYHQGLDIFNTNRNPIIDPATGTSALLGTNYNNKRHFRWYGNSATDRTRGIDGEIIWTPVRNFQSYIAFGWMWEAKTVSDASVGPTDLRVGAGYFSERIERAPEFTLKTYNKYTFTDGPLSGLDVGLGMRYSSEVVIGRNNGWTPNQGGLKGGDYMVFDLSLAYPYEIMGYKLKSQLGIYNLTDKTYSEGWYTLAPQRYINLTTTVTF